MKKQLTTAGTANTAEKLDVVWYLEIAHRVMRRISADSLLIAVPAVFAVARIGPSR
jgi:hypothetical protein